MPDVPQSEGLRTALSRGAEIGLARAIAEDRTPETIGHFIEARLGALSAAEVDYIRDLARAIVASAASLSSADPIEQADLENIPINGDLFGDDWAGKRIFWFGEWTFPGSEEWYRFSGTLPDTMDFADIVAYAAELAGGYIEQYPAKFQDPEGNPPSEITVRILGRERRF